jgi:hypothetical protein
MVEMSRVFQKRVKRPNKIKTNELGCNTHLKVAHVFQHNFTLLMLVAPDDARQPQSIIPGKLWVCMK